MFRFILVITTITAIAAISLPSHKDLEARLNITPVNSIHSNCDALEEYCKD